MRGSWEWRASNIGTLRGRERELAQLRTLSVERGVVTIVGPGGVGKTALATSFLRDDEGKSVFVDLRGVASGASEEAVAAAIVRELDVDVQGSDLYLTLEQLMPDLRALILDNCEHVVGAAAFVVARLRPWVSVICTSREPLGLAGERLVRLAPLDTSGPDSAAVALFVDRAIGCDPSFQSGDHVEAVSRICRAVGGLPLGIELAASRVGAVHVDDLAARLEVSTRVLRNPLRQEGGERDLQAVLRWSIDALDEEGKTAAGALAVFAQEFDLAAAEAVAATTPDTIAVLVERSILSRHEHAYFLLPPIQQLLRQLHPPAREVHGRYADYVIEVFRAVEQRGTLAERALVERHDADIDQVFAWLCDQARWEEASEVCALVNRVTSPDLRRPERQAQALLEAPVLSPAAQARALGVLARAASEDGRPEDAIELGSAAVTYARRSGNPAVLAMALTYRLGPDTDEALEEVLAIGREAAGAHTYFWALALSGRRYGDLLRLHEAVQLLERGVESARRDAPLSRRAVLLEFLGLVYVWSGRPKDAITTFDAAFEHAHTPALRAVIASGRGLALTLTGEFRAGLEIMRASLGDLNERRAHSMVSWCVELYADALFHSGDVDGSAAVLREALRSGYPSFRGRRAVQLAARLEHLGDIDAATAAIKRAEQESERIVPRLLVQLEIVKAALDRRGGELAAARTRLLRAARTATTGGAVPTALDALTHLALVSSDEGRIDEAALIRRCIDQQRLAAGVITGLDRLSFVRSRDEGPVALDEVLRVLGSARRRRSAAAFGWESLTPTEREVAKLVAAGATNAGVAEKLLIAPGTAKVHVSRILTKLGLRSRVEIASEVLSRPPDP